MESASVSEAKPGDAVACVNTEFEPKTFELYGEVIEEIAYRIEL